MPEDADVVDYLFHPMAYPVWWVVAGVLIVILIVAWVIGVYVWTLPIETLRRIPLVRSITHRVLRWKFARSLAKVSSDHRQGRLDTRAAFHEVSRIFRLFILFRTGYTARQMTATDVASSPLGPAAARVLAMTYPGQFDDADPRAVDTAVDAARTAVVTWR